MLSVRNRVSRRDVVECCEHLFGARISSGTVDAILQRVAEKAFGEHGLRVFEELFWSWEIYQHTRDRKEFKLRIRALRRELKPILVAHAAKQTRYKYTRGMARNLIKVLCLRPEPRSGARASVASAWSRPARVFPPPEPLPFRPRPAASAARFQGRLAPAMDERRRSD